MHRAAEKAAQPPLREPISSSYHKKKMQSAKAKMKDTASTVKEKVQINKAKAAEITGKMTARNKDHKKIVVEQSKAKQAQATADLHVEKAQHRAESAAAHHSVPLTGERLHRPVRGTHPATGKYV